MIKFVFNFTWRRNYTGPLFIHSFIYSFIHSIGTCRMWRFLAILRSFFHSSLLCTFSCHPSPPTFLPSSLTSSCHLFHDLLLNHVVPKFMYNTFLGILSSSILCICPNQHNLFNSYAWFYLKGYDTGNIRCWKWSSVFTECHTMM